MTEKDEIYNGVRDIVAKLYVLRDSCKGVHFIEKPDFSLIWFQGAGSLLRQAIEKFQILLQTMTKGGEQMGGKVYNNVEDIVSKLYVLRDSCKGLYHSEQADPDSIWFQGAGSILQEAIDQLQEALRVIEEHESSPDSHPDVSGMESASKESEEDVGEDREGKVATA